LGQGVDNVTFLRF